MTDENEVKAGELVKQVPGELGMSAPSYIEAGDMGMDHLQKEDIQMPRLAIAQLSSPEIIDGDPKYIPNLKFCQLFNNLTGEIYGTGPIVFTPLRGDPPRWIEFIPQSAGGGIRDMNVPANDPRTQFGPMGAPPIATKFYDFVVMLWPTKELIALSFKSTGLRAARQLNGLITARQRPLWSGTYQITVQSTQNSKGRYGVYQIRNVGWIPQAEVKYVKEMSEGLRNKIITIDHDSHLEDDTFDVAAMEAETAQSGGTEGM